MRYLLAGVLVVVGAGACRADGMLRVGMTEAEVRQVMGEPWLTVWQDGNLSITSCRRGYVHTDWFRGYQITDVGFDWDDRVYDFAVRYEPFTSPLDQLDALRRAFSPRPSP